MTIMGSQVGNHSCRYINASMPHAQTRLPQRQDVNISTVTSQVTRINDHMHALQRRVFVCEESNTFAREWRRTGASSIFSYMYVYSRLKHAYRYVYTSLKHAYRYVYTSLKHANVLSLKRRRAPKDAKKYTNKGRSTHNTNRRNEPTT